MSLDLTAIYQAAWALASADSGWIAKSRVLQHWADVPASQRPALFQAAQSMTVEPFANSDVAKWEIPLRYYIYISHTGDPTTPPQDLLAARIAVLVAAFAPPAGFDEQTLGGLVASCDVSGEIETDEGTLGTDAVAIVPVRIVVG
jgi:hypothetical protein